MTFAEVLPALAAGKKLRRASWMNYFVLSDGEFPTYMGLRDLLASDWEVVVEEPAVCCDHGRPVGWGCLKCTELVDARAMVTRLNETIARLKRDLEQTTAVLTIKEHETRRLERELAEAREVCRGARGAFEVLKKALEE